MVERNITQLALYYLDTETELLSIDRLKNLYLEKTSEIVYIIRDKKLYGIVCMGDIMRYSKNGTVKINKTYTALSGHNMMMAYGIFQRHLQIKKIPIINAQGELLGDYSRWDDIFYIERNQDKLMQKDILKKILGAYEKIYVVEPVEKEHFIYLQLLQYFNCFHIDYSILKKEYIYEKKAEKSICIFLDEDERRGMQCLYRILPVAYKNSKYDILVGNSRWATFKSIIYQLILEAEYNQLKIEKPLEFPENMVNKKATLLLSMLQKQGVACFNIYEDCKDITEYGKNLKREVKERLKIHPLRLQKPWPSKEENKEFYSELYNKKDYEDEIAQEEIMSTMNTYSYKKKVAKKYFHSNGRRITFFQPDKFDGVIYIFGPCITIGGFVEDQFTIPSFLQKKLLKKGYSYRVENYGDMVRTDAALDSKLREIGEFQDTDIVIYISFHDKAVNVPGESLEKIFEKNQIPSEWLRDIYYSHCNFKANNLVANSILKMIEPCLSNKDLLVKNHRRVEFDVNSIMANYVRNMYINKFLSGFSVNKYTGVGAITMNGNIFHKGHRYLIEQAGKQVDFLIVFVVEENTSLIPFEERLRMVYEGTRDIANILVISGEDIILSSKTFPQYITKRMDGAVTYNAEYDVNFFADYVAGPLHITHRFAGEAPKGKVLKIYYEAMERILPEKGIKFVKIPKFKVEGEPVNTLLIQKYLYNNEYERAFKLLPQSTTQFLQKYFTFANSN